MKTFKFRNAQMSIEIAGYGQYKLTGLGITIHYTDSETYDFCDDEDNVAKCTDARRSAYIALKNNL